MEPAIKPDLERSSTMRLSPSDIAKIDALIEVSLRYGTKQSGAKFGISPQMISNFFTTLRTLGVAVPKVSGGIKVRLTPEEMEAFAEFLKQQKKE